MSRPAAPPFEQTTMPAAEVEIDVRRVARLLASQHPDLAARPIRPFANGWDNVMFRLGDDLLVRLPRRESAARLIEHESRCLPLVAPHLPIPVPTPLRHGEPGEGYPWRWNVLPWLEGEPADRAPVDRTSAELFGDFLAALHRPAPDDAPDNPFRGGPVSSRHEAIESRLARLRLETDVVTPAIEGCWLEGLEAPRATSPVWLHGDLHPRNVLVREGRISGVIDWGDVTSGDPACDLAGIWMLFEDAGARARLVESIADDAALLARARAWAVIFAAILLDTGLRGDSRQAENGRRIFARLEADTQ